MYKLHRIFYIAVPLRVTFGLIVADLPRMCACRCARVVAGLCAVHETTIFYLWAITPVLFV